MTIVLVEDDYLAAQGLIEDLKKEFSGLTIEHISTESEFRSKVDWIAEVSPRAVIIDIMVRWADPKPRIPDPPAEVKENGPWRAGLRCAKLLRELGPKIPIILLSVLDAEDLKGHIPPGVIHLPKSPDPATLFENLRSVGLG